MKAIATLLAAGLLLQACSPPSPSASSNLIKRRGSYPSPGGSYSLEIGRKSTSLVDYKIVSVSTRKEFAPKDLFSDAMRWAAFWENEGALWVHSSDMGISVWQADKNGDFTQTWLGPNSELVPKIPQEVWDYMPSSTHRHWGSRRAGDTEQGAAPNP